MRHRAAFGLWRKGSRGIAAADPLEELGRACASASATGARSTGSERARGSVSPRESCLHPARPDPRGRAALTKDSKALHVQDHPPRSILGHDLPLGGSSARRRALRRARAFRHAAPPRGRRAHPADGRRLRPRARHDHDGHPGARQDHTGNAGSLQGRRRLRRLRRSAGTAAAREPCRTRGAGRRRTRRRAGLPAAARVQGSGQPRDRHHRLPQQGPGVLGGQVRQVLRQPDRLYRRRQLRSPRLRHRGAQGRGGARSSRPGRGHRPAADDERLRRDHATGRGEDDGVAQRDHGRRHRDVRLVPRHRRRRDQVRLRRRPGLRRAPGRLQGADAAPAALQGRGVEGLRRLRARLPGREAALRRGQAQLQEVQGPAAARGEDARAGCAGAVAQLQGSEPRLLDGRRAGRGGALHPVQQADLHRGLPGRYRHPPLHPPPPGARHGRRARRHQRVQPVPVGLRTRLPAGVAVRGAVRRREEQEAADGGRGDRPPGALRRRQRARAEGRAAARRAQARARRHRRLRPRGARRRRRPGAATAAT